MKAIDIIKMMLPGLLPLFVYIIADEIWGEEIGLYIALGFGGLQLLFIYLKEKRVDKFVFLDILLILIMGAVSIILQNPIFFKLKPGIIAGLISVFLGISAFSDKNLLLMMSQRYLKGIKISTHQEKRIKKTIKLLFWLFLLHTALVFYSAIFMSKEAWGFVSGLLFYLILAGVFVFELLKNFINKRKNNAEEILPEINENGNIIGHITRSQAHDCSKKLHPVIHLHIIDDDFNILLQKRSLTKFLLPGKWDSAVGGHISYGESIETALKRETFEELGLKIDKFDFLTKYIWETDIERELVFVFLVKNNGFDFVPNSEVDQVRFWSVNEITQNIGKNVFTPNFEIDFKNILLKIMSDISKK